MNFRNSVFLGFRKNIVFKDVGNSVIFFGGLDIIVVLEKRNFCSLLGFLMVSGLGLRFKEKIFKEN